MPDDVVSSKHPSPLRRWVFNIALLVISGLVALGVSELVVRIALPQQALPEWYRDDPVYGRSLKPDFHQRFTFLGGPTIDVRTNSHGLRDREPPAPGEGRPRVLFLGDSFVFGYGIGVAERLDTRLAEEFSKADRRITTINAGVPTWGTLQELKFATEHLDRFDPDVIVLVYCGNDQQNDREFLEATTSFRERGAIPVPGKAWLRAHSHLYRLALYVTAAWRQGAANRAHANADQATRLDRQTASALTEDDWQRTREVIREFIHQVREKRPEVTLYLLATEPTDDAIRVELTRIAEDPAIEFVDFKDTAAQLDPAARRLPHDPHWSPAMHQLAADALYSALTY